MIVNAMLVFVCKNWKFVIAILSGIVLCVGGDYCISNLLVFRIKLLTALGR